MSELSFNRYLHQIEQSIRELKELQSLLYKDNRVTSRGDNRVITLIVSDITSLLAAFAYQLRKEDVDPNQIYQLRIKLQNALIQLQEGMPYQSIEKENLDVPHSLQEVVYELENVANQSEKENVDSEPIDRLQTRLKKVINLLHKQINYQEKNRDFLYNISLLYEAVNFLENITYRLNDVLHDAFLDSTGTRTRILAIWDQTDDTGSSPNIPGVEQSFGTEHTEAQINQYIQERRVPPGLGRDLQMHGTHVASIAAGRPGNHFPGGVAPDAKIVVVIPRLKTNLRDSYSLGYSLTHGLALKYIKHIAAQNQIPVVVNVSQGMNAGAHDGTSLLELQFDEFSGGGRDC
ncbi:S8 family serine peptidase [Nostoc sp. CHAB 5784]|uniref:S8 family serine peptidase n=1 Tax=Nostoc mirabile TaxID=2907820 RepID=UPI001E41295E|nr:S8 family serine peptidase [Nostoc mirabile]MCC5670778.1 S8 family serine peptidase [Nostoc mirabile CHAB5784]